ncbi:MAG TPA: DEAD/DEAH box helicase, partial [Anaerolineae bacterium]|nr:DEAD/DEAH box helicase [Anaerolineae bacterium]
SLQSGSRDKQSVIPVLDQLRADRAFMRNVAAWERIPPRAARYAPAPSTLHTRLLDVLRTQGIEQLYTHQAAAIESTKRGENPVVVTSTASGKTLCYNLAVLNTLHREPSATALYLFPTKALAHDQISNLQSLITALGANISARAYDGDTPRDRRKSAREAGGLVITNPDMLHTGILPHHTRWASLFESLRYVVVDELHAYRGVFGSHFANVLRRLKRVCGFYGSRPQFILTSATIANPVQLAERLIEEPVTLIDDDGAPRGEKHFIFYNPPLIDPALGQRRSSVLEARDVAARFLLAGVQTILFARARLTTEVLLTYVRDAVAAQGGDASAIHGYRGGYLAEERRAIEKALRDGSARGVVATNALELGIDIGQLDAAILAGYPGTIASTWQQAGRAGRRADASVAILVASAAPLDQFLVMHPRFFFERSPEHGLIAPDNLVILTNHLKCASFELPFDAGEQFGRFQQTSELLDALVEEGILHREKANQRAGESVGQRYFWMADSYPAQDVSLRTSSADTIVILDSSGGRAQSIGQIDRDTAPVLVYEGAIYMHEGLQYLVERLDWENGQAFVRPASVDYYTDASSTVDVQVLEEFERAEAGTTIKSQGEVMVTTQPVGFRKIKLYTHETLGRGEIDLPEQHMQTTAYWFCVEPALADRLTIEGILFAPNDYGPNWDEQREAARKRDGYRCRQCGAPEPSPQPPPAGKTPAGEGGRQHDVHHLRPFREFAYVRGQNENYKQANALENLITLCTACHRRVEAARGVRGALGGLGQVMRQIAPLYLMCDPRDIDVLAEARSPFTELPTITIFDRVAGGIGLSQECFDLHDDLLRAARDLVASCRCENGCPACVGPAGEGGLDTKALTLKLLKVLAG